MMTAREQATQAMKRAWTIRKAAAVECGCKVSEVVFSLCLVQAWREVKTMKQTTLERVQNAIAKFDFTAQETAKGIAVYNKKGVLAATVVNGKVDQKYQGSKNLCGALVRDAIKAVL